MCFLKTKEDSDFVSFCEENLYEDKLSEEKS